MIGDSRPPATMPRAIRDLWRGYMPLSRAFWEHAVLYVALANLFATAVALGTMAADWPIALSIGIYLLPAPYVVVAVVGVWRSADAYREPSHWASLARVFAIAWGLFMVLV